MEEKDINEVLNYFPSYVKIHETVSKQSRIFIQAAIERRQREEDADTFDNEVEKLKGYNLLSFLHFVLNDKEEAIRYNDLALEVNNRNINALACRTFYHLKWSEFYKSSQTCKKLKFFKNGFMVEKLSARAEVAYLFSKFGMKFYDEAKRRFEDVLNEVDTEEVPKLYKCSWYFSLAQTIRRQLNIHNTPTPLEPKQTEALYRRVINLFTDIIYTSGDSVNRYKAKAFAELGLVLHFNKIYKLRSIYSPEECMLKALRLCSEDTCVLERCGKYFRLTKKINDAIRCFEMAIEIRETSFSYHHLALCYKVKLFEEQNELNANGAIQSVNRNSVRQASNRRNMNMNWRDRSQAGLSRDWTSDFGDEQTSERGSNRGHGRGRGTRGSLKVFNGKRYEPMSPEEKFHSKVLKCPEQLPFISPFETTTIFELLDKAIKISHDNNTGAMYDKGLILRASKQLGQAIEIFKLVIENNSSSGIQLANAYEQAALCYIEMAENSPANKEEYEFDAKMYLKKAMELACNMIRKIPNLRRCWHSIPTLKMLLLKQASTKENLREIAHFYKLLDNYSAAIKFLDRILQMEDDEREQQKVLKEIIEANLNLNNINDATLALEICLCLPNGNELINTETIVKVYVKGGIDAWKHNEREIATRRFRTAIQYGRIPVDESRTMEYENVFDLFMLSSSLSEDKARQLCNKLKCFGLNITLNSDDVLPGRLVREEIMDRINVSQYALIYIGSEDEKADLDYLKIYTHIERDFKLISEGGRLEDDSLYRTYPVIKFNCEMMDGNGNLTDDFLNWLEELFFHIKCVCMDD